MSFELFAGVMLALLCVALLLAVLLAKAFRASLVPAISVPAGPPQKARPARISFRRNAPAANQRPAPAGKPDQPRIRQLKSANGEASPDGYYADVERRLTHAFQLYERGRISIATYGAMAAQLHAEVKSDLASGALVPENRSDEMAQALKAVEWCRAWARAQCEGDLQTA